MHKIQGYRYGRCMYCVAVRVSQVGKVLCYSVRVAVQ